MQFRKTFMNICSIHFYAIIQRVINIRLIQSIEHNVRVYSLKINKTCNESFLFSFSITIPDLSGVLEKHCKFNRSLLEHFRLPLVFYVVDLRAIENNFFQTQWAVPWESVMYICLNLFVPDILVLREFYQRLTYKQSYMFTCLHVWLFNSVYNFHEVWSFNAGLTK